MAAISSTRLLPVETPPTISRASSSSSARTSSQISIELDTQIFSEEICDLKAIHTCKVENLSKLKSELNTARNSLKDVSKKIQELSSKIGEVETSLNQYEKTTTHLDSLKQNLAQVSAERRKLIFQEISGILSKMPELVSKNTEDKNKKNTLIENRTVLVTERNSLQERVKKLTEQANEVDNEVSDSLRLIEIAERINNAKASSSSILLTFSDRDDRKSLETDEKKETSKKRQLLPSNTTRSSNNSQTSNKKQKLLTTCPAFKRFLKLECLPDADEFFYGKAISGNRYEVTVRLPRREIIFIIPQDATPRLRMHLIYKAFMKNNVIRWTKFGALFTKKNAKNIASTLATDRKRLNGKYTEDGVEYELAWPLEKKYGKKKTRQMLAYNYNRFILENGKNFSVDELAKGLLEGDFYKNTRTTIENIKKRLIEALDEAVNNEGFVNKGIKGLGKKLSPSKALEERRAFIFPSAASL